MRSGLLITMPHKHAVARYCETLSEIYRLLRTASVIRRNLNGTWQGDIQGGASFVKAQID